jgi:hypothetical protein
MRVVIKPAGFAVVIGAILGLAAIVIFLQMQGGKDKATNTTVAKANGAKTAPKGTTPARGGSESLIIDPTAFPWTLAIQTPAAATKEEFKAPDLPGKIKHAVRLKVTQVDPNKFWCAQLIKRVPQAIKANHSLEVRFWARSTTNTAVHVVFEEGQSPHTPELDKVIRFTPEWKEYTLKFRTKQDHTEVQPNFCLKAGISPGELEISEVRVIDLGQ